jgi:hypothetical protein
MPETIPQNIHPINFAVNAYKGRSRLESSERILNFYAEPTPLDSPFKAAAIFNTPGLLSWAESNNYNPIYGVLVMGNYLYVIIGLTLYQISTTKIITALGTLGTTPNVVMMTQNGIQLTILTSTGQSYYYDSSSNIFGQITNVNYQLSGSVDSSDGYTIFSVQNSGQFFISALRDTTSYSALDFATAEALSDDIVRIVVYNRQLFIFGTNSIEVWYDTGNLTFPFQRIDGVLIERGLGAKFSTAIEVDGIYFIGDDGIIYRTRGYSLQRISTFAIEQAITNYSTFQDASAFIYTQAGHKFYCITFPSAKKTWVYDITTELWSERGSLDATQTSIQQWICQYHAYFNNTNIVNGTMNGKLYELDLNTYTEDGIPIIAQARSATQFDSYNYKFIDKLGLMMDFGVGVDGSGQGINPLLMMRYSIDGGYTWSNETTASIGDIGVYPQEVFWDRLGKCRSIIFEITISDPVKRTILGGYMKVKEGAF